MKITHNKLNFLVSKVVQEQFFYEKNYKKQIIQENIFKNIMSKFGKKSDNKAKAGNEKEKSEFTGMNVQKIIDTIKNAKDYSTMASMINEFLRRIGQKEDSVSENMATEVLKLIFSNENLKSFNDDDTYKLMNYLVFNYAKFVKNEPEYSKMNCIAKIAYRIPNMSPKTLENLMDRFYGIAGTGRDNNQSFFNTLGTLMKYQKNIDYDEFYDRMGESFIKHIIDTEPSFRGRFKDILQTGRQTYGGQKILALALANPGKTVEYSQGSRTNRDNYNDDDQKTSGRYVRDIHPDGAHKNHGSYFDKRHYHDDDDQKTRGRYIRDIHPDGARYRG